MPKKQDGHDTLLSATTAAIDSAKASGHLTAFDEGAVHALKMVARDIDQLEHGVNPAGRFDNVSMGAYLKYLNALGLTPEARADLAKKLEGTGAKKPESKLEKFNVLDKKSA